MAGFPAGERDEESPECHRLSGGSAGAKRAGAASLRRFPTAAEGGRTRETVRSQSMLMATLPKNLPLSR